MKLIWNLLGAEVYLGPCKTFFVETANGHKLILDKIVTDKVLDMFLRQKNMYWRLKNVEWCLTLTGHS